MSENGHSVSYLAAAAELTRAIDPDQIDAIAHGLARARERGGRLFVLGVGGGLREFRPSWIGVPDQDEGGLVLSRRRTGQIGAGEV